MTETEVLAGLQEALEILQAMRDDVEQLELGL